MRMGIRRFCRGAGLEVLAGLVGRVVLAVIESRGVLRLKAVGRSG